MPGKPAIDGVIYAANCLQQVAMPVKHGLPLVLANCFGNYGTAAFIPDDRHGQRLAVEYLVERGRDSGAAIPELVIPSPGEWFGPPAVRAFQRLPFKPDGFASHMDSIRVSYEFHIAQTAVNKSENRLPPDEPR